MFLLSFIVLLNPFVNKVLINKTISMPKIGAKYLNVSLIMIGRPYKYNDTFINLTHEEAIINTLKSFNAPIILNADFGHLKPCFPILCGSIGNIEIKNNNIKIEYNLK